MAAPSDTEIELAFYEQFLWGKGLTPYPVQEQAISQIVAGHSVMVTVPTGTGKTLLAKAGIFAALQRGFRAIYTTPLRALTEEKYRELGQEFGEANVGFATGDYKVNRDAPIQVEVAEILWNRIIADKSACPAEVVIMDEGHYFADNERGYVWEQAIIGLDPRTQLVVLSATVGRPDRFCHWVELVRRVPMHLVESRERRIPLTHEFREEMLLDTVKSLVASGDIPAIIFVFGRAQCFDVARLLRSCRRFTTDAEKALIEAACDDVLLGAGGGPELRSLLAHGIGIHHAGIMPRYKQLVEELALQRLVKFVVSTETIAAGINLPARTVVFPSLRKFVRNAPRLVTPAEFHQMAGRAGRPQFDDRGLAIALAPEEVVTELKRELKDGAKRPGYDESKIRKNVYNRARSDAQKKGDILWTPETHSEVVKGEPAELISKTKISAEQVLALGLPDLRTHVLPGGPIGPSAAAAPGALTDEAKAGAGTAVGPDDAAPGAATPGAVAPGATAPGDVAPGAAAPGDGAPGATAPDAAAPVAAVAGASGLSAAEVARAEAVELSLPPSMRLDIVTVIDNLLLDDREKRQQHRVLAHLVANMRAIGVLDESGWQVAGRMVGKLQGLDGLFIYYALFTYPLDYVELREMIEFMIDHDVIAKLLARKDEDKKKDWIRARLRELRMENAQVSWEDVEAQWEQEHPRQLTRIEQIHQEFGAKVPHPELHGGKRAKNVWGQLEDEGVSFMDFVEREGLAREEGNLFSYLIRVMNFARKLSDATGLPQFGDIADKVRAKLARVDVRMVEGMEW